MCCDLFAVQGLLAALDSLCVSAVWTPVVQSQDAKKQEKKREDNPDLRCSSAAFHLPCYTAA